MTPAAAVARRLAWAALVVWTALTLAFATNHLLPSDPARLVAGAQARPADVARVRAQLGLDRPLHVQYLRFFGRLVHLGPAPTGPRDEAHGTCGTLGPIHLDLGKSHQSRRAVAAILAERLPRTLALALAAVVLQGVLGTAGGAVAAATRRRALDRALVGAGAFGQAVPTFVLGLALQWVLAQELGVLPLDGFGETTGEHLAGLVLPALTLGLYGGAQYVRVVREGVREALAEDFVRTARAKGAGPARVVLGHALRVAAAPLVTLLGLDLGALVGGALVTESLFRWPGLGSLAVSAALDRDGPVLFGCVLVTAVGVVGATLLVDATQALLDPRARRAAD